MTRAKSLILGMAILLVAVLGYGQMNNRGNRNNCTFNSTAAELKGTILNIQTKDSRRLGQKGVHIELQTEAGKSWVHLGPQAYIDSAKITLKKGQSVQINAFKGNYQGQMVYF